MNDYKKYAADGFTYAEILLSLMTIGIIMLVMPGILSLFQSLELNDDNYDLDIFTLDIIETYEASTEIEVESASQLNFTTKRGVISYRYVDERIIKSIDGSGFVTLMYNVRSYSLSEDKDKITINIKGDSDETFIFKK